MEQTARALRHVLDLSEADSVDVVKWNVQAAKKAIDFLAEKRLEAIAEEAARENARMRSGATVIGISLGRMETPNRERD